MNNVSNILMINNQSKIDCLDENKKKQLPIFANSFNKLIGNKITSEDLIIVEPINLLLRKTKQNNIMIILFIFIIKIIFNIF